MTDVELFFRRDYMFSKEDILRSIDLLMDHVENDPETGYTKELINNKLLLYKKFYKKIEKTILPELKELYWYYNYYYSGTGMELRLCSGEKINLSEDKEYISNMSLLTNQLLVRVECDYVLPEKFAIIQEVPVSTVNQWLNKGKLRYAKYADGRWLIPSTSEKPNRNFGVAQYTLKVDDPPVIEEFPIVSICESVTIFKNGQRFDCDFDNYKTEFYQKMLLSSDEVERLEYALIKSGKAIPEMPLQFVVSLRREN